MPGRKANVPGMPGIAMPVGVDEDYTSIYRGVVEDVADPQMRKRVRVRVNGIHPQSVASDRLAWAELACLPSSSLAGDFFPFQVGDRVFVMFEGGDRNKPLVTGGWIARPANLSDIPSEVSVDYARTQSRWVRVDRVGNSITMSELPEEEFLKLASGAAEITLDQKDGSVTLRAASSQVRTEGNSSETEVTFYSVTANQILMTADSMGKLDAPAGLIQIMSDFEASLHALSKTGTGVVRIGGYLPRYKGVAAPLTPGMGFRQTPVVEVCARAVHVGTAAGQMVSGGPQPETETTAINGVEVLITAAPATNSPSGKTVKITIDSAGDVVIQSTTKVRVEAPTAEVEADDVVVEATTVSVDAEEVAVDATTVTVDADEVDINATTAIRMA